MNILAVDTSSQALGVTLRTDSYSEERTCVSKNLLHSEHLMPVVLELCGNAGISTTDIDLLACTRGPGSFTGLRIGMAALKGMAYGLEKPLVSVSTLETYARCVPFFDGAIVAVQDAKKQRFYLSAFENRLSDDGRTETVRLMPDTDGCAQDLVQVLEPYSSILITGPDAMLFKEELSSVLQNRMIICDNQVRPVGSALIALAVETYREKGPDDIGQGPVYLRKSDAEIALEQRLKEANRS